MAIRSFFALVFRPFSAKSKRHKELSVIYNKLQEQGPISALDINREDNKHINLLKALSILSGAQGSIQEIHYGYWVVEQCGCPEDDQNKNASPAYVSAINQVQRLLVEHRPRNRKQLEALLS
jgi:hypothetical protein